jgi:peptidoglycan/xylan/chitin deacetylase (PgdA/CDA1 family)
MPGELGLNILLTLDYEVFFGRNTGTVERTLLEPSAALCMLAKRYGVPLVFFVDIGFVLRLYAEGQRFPSLMRDYDAVMRQLERFVADGHELQLHVHSHWEDSRWNGDSWDVDTRRYRLHDFDSAGVLEILRRYTNALRSLTAGDDVVAFRAGGWVIQPFTQIREQLLDVGVCIDSTVFPGGTSDSETHQFDFTSSPHESRWFFEDDPLVVAPKGRFLEVPIASMKLPPLFYWQLAVAKKLGGGMHRSYGDGNAIPLSRADMLDKLSRWTTSVVSLDGYKASFLERAFAQYKKNGKTDFVVIGHPKALSRYSLQKLEKFLKCHQTDKFVGYRAYRGLFSKLTSS